MLENLRSLRKFFEPSSSLPSVTPAEAEIQVGWWCGRPVRHKLLLARRKRAMDTGFRRYDGKEPAFQVRLRLGRARRSVIN